jgi:hypothetical protein
MEDSPTCYWDDILFDDVQLRIMQCLNKADQLMFAHTCKAYFKKYLPDCSLLLTLCAHGTADQLNAYKDLLLPNGKLLCSFDRFISFGGVVAIEWLDSIEPIPKLTPDHMVTAVSSGNLQGVQWCVSRGVGFQWVTPRDFMQPRVPLPILEFAIGNGHISLRDPDEYMHWAIICCQYDKIEFLLNQNAGFCNECFNHGISTSNLDMVKWLWNKGCTYEYNTFSRALFNVPYVPIDEWTPRVVPIWDFLFEISCPLNIDAAVDKYKYYRQQNDQIDLAFDWLDSHGIKCDEPESDMMILGPEINDN